MEDYYENLMDEMDAAVFSGEILFTNLEEFDNMVARWRRAIDNHKETEE